MKYSKYELVLKKAKVRESKVLFDAGIISSSQTACDFACNIMKLHEHPEEHVGMVCLASNGTISGYSEVSHGTVSSSMLSPREIFQMAFVQNAVAIILFHNHPSGNIIPSPDDISSTQRLVAAGRLIGIKVLDHIIVNPDGDYTSMKEAGLLDIEQDEDNDEDCA